MSSHKHIDLASLFQVTLGWNEEHESAFFKIGVQRQNLALFHNTTSHEDQMLVTQSMALLMACVAEGDKADEFRTEMLALITKRFSPDELFGSILDNAADGVQH